MIFPGKKSNFPDTEKCEQNLLSDYLMTISSLYSGVFDLALRYTWRLMLSFGGTPNTNKRRFWP
jgi:hypothetical protein